MQYDFYFLKYDHMHVDKDLTYVYTFLFLSLHFFSLMSCLLMSLNKMCVLGVGRISSLIFTRLLVRD